MLRTLCLGGCALAALLCGTGPAAAQPNATATARPNVETLVVTAQKREQDQQDVSLSLDVLAGDTLDFISAAGEDLLFLAGRSPSVYAESSSGRIFPRFYIRGLGNTDFDLNANQPVSLVYDEVAFENPVLKGFPVFDLDRIEILRGPQGTLFGRNTPAGAIKFESAKPTFTPEGFARLSYGRFNAVDAEAALSGALIDDRVAGRLSLLFQRRDDFVDNTFDGGEDGFEEFDEFAGRAQFLIDLGGGATTLLNVHGRSLSGGSRVFRANVIVPGEGGVIAGFDRRETAQDATQILEIDSIGATVTTEIPLGFGDLISVTGFETVSLEARGDVDGGFGADFAPPAGPGSIPFSAETADNITGHRQITQEVRLNFQPHESVDATVGGFFFSENLEIENLSFDTLSGGTLNGRAVQDQETTAWAVFGSADWAFTDKLSAQGGIRISGETKDFVAARLVGPFGSGTLTPDPVDLEDTVVTGDLTLRYDVNEQFGLFTRYARSFRAPNAQGRIVFGDAITVADTETIDSIEAGVKSGFWGGRARVNLTGFYFQTDNQQLTAVGGAGNFNQLLNADSVVGYGFELDTGFRPFDGLEITAGMSLNETEVRDEDLEVGVCAAPCTVLDPINPETGNALIDGNPLPQAPQYIANLTARYGLPVFGGSGEVFLFTDWFYRSNVNFFLYESIEFHDRGLVEGGLRAGYVHGGGAWELSAFGRNITNDVSLEGAIDFNNLAAFVNEPRTWGVEFVTRF